MTSALADTFYWVALTDPDDALYAQAARLGELLAPSLIVTTDGVLVEFLTFFSGSLWMRRRVVETVRALARDRNVHIAPQSRESFSGRIRLVRRPFRQALQPHGLHRHGNHAPGRTD